MPPLPVVFLGSPLLLSQAKDFFGLKLHCEFFSDLPPGPFSLKSFPLLPDSALCVPSVFLSPEKNQELLLHAGERWMKRASKTTEVAAQQRLCWSLVKLFFVLALGKNLSKLCISAFFPFSLFLFLPLSSSPSSPFYPLFPSIPFSSHFQSHRPLWRRSIHLICWPQVTLHAFNAKSKGLLKSRLLGSRTIRKYMKVTHTGCPLSILWLC